MGRQCQDEIRPARIVLAMKDLKDRLGRTGCIVDADDAVRERRRVRGALDYPASDHPGTEQL